jgi:hypothetical protein
MRKASSQIGKKRPLAAEEMRYPADVEPKPVGAVGIQSWAIAAGRPAGEVEKGRFIFLRCGGQREKAGTDGSGVGKAETGGETFALARFVERGNEKSPLFIADERQRPVSRKLRVAVRCFLPPQPLDRKLREKDGNEATHD